MSKVLYFFILLSVVFAAFYIFRDKLDFALEKDDGVVIYSNAVQNELDFLNRTLNSFSGSEDSLQMKELILLSGISIKKNIDNITPHCDNAVSLKINDFALKVMVGIGALSNSDIDKDEIKVLTDDLKKNSRVLANITKLASDKYSDKEKEKREAGFTEILGDLRYLILFFLGLSLIVTGFAFFQDIRLKRLADSISIGKDYSKENIRRALDEIKGASEKHSQDVEKTLIRERMVGKRKEILLDAIPAGLFSCDSKGRVTLMNSKIRSWFDIESDMSGEDVKDVFLEMGIDRSHLEKFSHKGDVFWISEHQSSNEQFYVVTNITEQEEMSRKLLDSERLVSIGEMASRITHEIRNPLSTVKLNSEYMVENIEKMDSSEMLSSLSLIVHEVERLESITEKYMDIVRYRNNEETEKNVQLPFDLVQFSSFHSSEFQKRKVEVDLDVDTECTLAITLSSFKEIMLNLYKNAWEELESGGKVKVSVFLEDKMVAVAVEDSGRGVPEEEKKKVFKNFYTNKPGGTGIGLSHSRKLAEEAGGSLEIKDSDLGGAKMLLKIPQKV